MKITLTQAADRFKASDNILIIAHKAPDGDTLGCAFALTYALQKLGKRVRADCSDGFPERYGFMYKGYVPEAFEPSFIVSVDIADTQLFGEKTEIYANKVDLAIDHHPSNTLFAKETLLEPKAAATCEIVFDLIQALGVPLDLDMATCLYTGITTDTGCFKYSNTTPATMRKAADLMALGVDNVWINRYLFETKSLSRIEMEKLVLEGLAFFFDNKCALICITKQMMADSDADEYELEGVSGIPRQIEGVEVGVTIRERDNGYKISVRTKEPIDASEICKAFGGGGHNRAAGAFISGRREEVTAKLVEVIGSFLNFKIGK